MTYDPSDTPPLESPLRNLERSFIDEYVRSRGHDPLDLNGMPASEREALLAEASVHASARLAEVESRAHYLGDIHEAKIGSS
jgi:hypothetical protein